jgi:dephospho-CoA kinase
MRRDQVHANERLFYWNLLRQAQEAGEVTTTISVSGLEVLLKDANLQAEAERQRMFNELVEALYGSRLRRPAAYSEVLWSDLLASVRRLANHP